MKKAIITGISGQDGSYLSEFLIKKGYQVHGIVQDVELKYPEHKLWRIKAVFKKLKLYACSIEDYAAISRIVKKIKPQECYHLAAQSFVNYSFDGESAAINTNINSTLGILSALRNYAPKCRFYFAGSSEMFGKTFVSPQNENTPFNPRSPYGISKMAGFHLTRNYRESYGLFACSGILYNHESPRRGEEFVTRKITCAAAKIKSGLVDELRLGNLEARRDWGFSGDYIKAMWLMLQQKQPDDYVIATGKDHSVKEFVQEAFRCVGLDWKKYLVVDKAFYRPGEKNILKGDYSKARKILGWKPEVDFKQLVKMMVDADIKRLQGY